MSVETLRPADRPEAGADVYRGRIAEAIGDGWQYLGSSVAPEQTAVRTLLMSPTGQLETHSVAVEAQTAPSIVDLLPGASWDEREAYELHGIGFTGHEPLRPLINHGPLAEWTVPVRGADVHQVAVGPIHAGVIESGHFRFHLVGDQILHLDAQLFYKHRGLEKAAEGSDLAGGARYIARACAACSVSNGLAYAHACEQALGLLPPAELARVRTVLLELERVWNLFNDISAICAGVGLAAGNHQFAAFTERARRLNHQLTGHRFLAGSVRVGESALVADAEAVRNLRVELARLRDEAARAWKQITFNHSFAERLPAVGTLTAEQVRQLGTVGPAARAAGVGFDVRAHCTRLAYGSSFRVAALDRPDGDVRARFEQRGLELWQSLAILDRLLDGPLEAVDAQPGEPSSQVGVGVVESPRGATSCVLERVDHQLVRVRLRTGSFANWPSVATAAVGNLVPDFPLINKSFELCYACADR